MSLFNRQDFPMLSQPIIYFDSAATTLKPLVVIEAITKFYSHHYGTVHRAIYRLSAEATAQYDAVRIEAQQFLHAKSSDEIIFTKGTTEAINLVAFSFGEAFVQAGDEILISALEHHSNIVPWQLLCQRKKAHLQVIPILDSGEIDLETYEKLLTPRTKLVNIAHISNVLGMINPIQQMIKMAHAKGAKVLIDGAQSAPHMPIDVQALDCDFFAFSGHKIYGPTGIGILYGKKQLLEQMPPYQGGGDMIQTVAFEKTIYQQPPLKFEAGTPMIAEVIGLGAALKYVQSHGLSQIAAYETKLIQQALSELRAIDGIRIYGTDDRTALITFNLEGVHPLDAATFLDLKGIFVRSGHLCAQPLLRRFGCTAALRLSLAPYNTTEEVSCFCTELSKILSLIQ